MTPADQRKPKAALMKQTGVKDIRTLNKYILEAQQTTPEDYDPDAYLANSAKTVDAALIRACERGSPGALKAYYQITNRLVEKSENINIDLSGDDIFAIREKANRELREGGFLGRGAGEVPDKPVILPSEIREDTG